MFSKLKRKDNDFLEWMKFTFYMKQLNDMTDHSKTVIINNGPYIYLIPTYTTTSYRTIVQKGKNKMHIKNLIHHTMVMCNKPEKVKILFCQALFYVWSIKYLFTESLLTKKHLKLSYHTNLK